MLLLLSGATIMQRLKVAFEFSFASGPTYRLILLNEKVKSPVEWSYTSPRRAKATWSMSSRKTALCDWESDWRWGRPELAAMGLVKMYGWSCRRRTEIITKHAEDRNLWNKKIDVLLFFLSTALKIRLQSIIDSLIFSLLFHSVALRLFFDDEAVSWGLKLGLLWKSLCWFISVVITTQSHPKPTLKFISYKKGKFTHRLQNYLQLENKKCNISHQNGRFIHN